MTCMQCALAKYLYTSRQTAAPPPAAATPRARTFAFEQQIEQIDQFGAAEISEIGGIGLIHQASG